MSTVELSKRKKGHEIQEESKADRDKHLLVNISHIKDLQSIFQWGKEYRIIHFHFGSINLRTSKSATHDLHRG